MLGVLPGFRMSTVLASFQLVESLPARQHLLKYSVSVVTAASLRLRSASTRPKLHLSRENGDCSSNINFFQNLLAIGDFWLSTSQF